MQIKIPWFSVNPKLLFQIDVENESAIESLENETENENELAPKDIELVCSKMTSEEVSKVFQGTTVSSICHFLSHMNKGYTCSCSNEILSFSDFSYSLKIKNSFTTCLFYYCMVACCYRQDRSIRGVATTSLGVLSNMMAASESSPTDQRIKNAIVQSFEHVAVLALDHMKMEDVYLQIQTVSNN